MKLNLTFKQTFLQRYTPFLSRAHAAVCVNLSMARQLLTHIKFSQHMADVDVKTTERL